MDEAPPQPTALPPHIEEAMGSIERLHKDHQRGATRIQRWVDQLTAAFGRPRFVGALTLIILSWVFGNLVVLAAHGRPPDPPPFFWLDGVMTILAVYMTALILTTQRRADQLAAHREQLTLELAILAEQKTTKMIALMEELRRDSPTIRDRVDAVADAMAEPTDHQAVLQAIKDNQALDPAEPEPAPSTAEEEDAV